VVLTPAVLFALVLYACLPACGPGARTRTLRAGLISLNVARDTMLAVSKEREAQIVEHAATKEQGRAELDAWRKRVDTAATALEVGYRAIYTASILDDAKSLTDATAAVAQVIAIVATLKPTRETTQ
jgi:hypothetical protein